ncbi:MAG: septal ring lytic transglycosylase RlpA family protein [Pseudomonadota bacterium]
MATEAGSWKGRARIGLAAAAAVSLAACATVHRPAPAPAVRAGPPGTMRPYQVAGVWYRPAVQPGYDKTGLASWYGPRSHNRTTADGEMFDADVASAAHATLPLPSTVEVTNLDNGRRLRVRVNDRGPFARDRIIDLSRRAAKDLGFYEKGMARVRVRYVGPARSAASRDEPRYASALVVSSPAASEPYRVQAAAFAERVNAERAAARLAAEGVTSIEAFDRDGVTLFHVVVKGAAGEVARSLRARVIGAGFPGAKVVGPS